jgi:exonuclease SbcD
MRFLVFSDVHAHPFVYEATHVSFEGFPGKHNSRLVDTCNALIEVAQYAVQHQVQTVLFGGDLFHTRQAVRTLAFNLVYHVIKKHFSDAGLDLIMIPGNHDYADRNGAVHSLETLKSLQGVTVLDSVTKMASQQPGLQIVSVPYTDNVNKAREHLQLAASLTAGDEPVVLLAHLGTEGAIVGSDYVMLSPNDITVDDIPLRQFDLCLFGHYHQHQQIAKNAHYIGALTQHNWGDANTTRGFLDITLTKEHYGITRIETKAPKFVRCESIAELEAVDPSNFVALRTDEAVDPDKLRELHPTLKIEIKKQDKAGIEFNATCLNITAALQPWVQNNAGSLDPVTLLKLGEDLLKEGLGNEVQDA